MVFNFSVSIWKFTIAIKIDLFDIDPSDRDIKVGITLKVSW